MCGDCQYVRILVEGRSLDNMQRRAVLEGLHHRAKEKKATTTGSSSSGSVRSTRSYSNDMETEESTSDCGVGASRPSSSSNPCLVNGTTDVICSGQYIVMDIDFHQRQSDSQAAGCDVAVAAAASTMAASAASRLKQCGFLGIFSLLSHENKLSVVHCHVQRLNEDQTTSHMETTSDGDGSGSDEDDDHVTAKGHCVGGGTSVVIKSKEELVFQVGFRTFKARPVFSEANLNSDKHKFERFWRIGGFSVASIYAPISFMPTPVLIFKQTRAAITDLRDPSCAGLQLVGTGTVGGVDPDRIILKKVILTGHPIRVRKKFAVVKHLFHDPHDVRWFKPAEMVTKHGLRGNITEPVGTHGLLKALFSAPIKQNDTVMLILYKRVYPKLPEKGSHIVTLDIV